MKKMLVLLLTLCLLAGMVPLGAGAVEGTSCESGIECTHEAAIGDTHYDTLQEAINAATSGARVTLCKDINPSDPITVSTTLTLDLAGHKIANTSEIWDDTEDKKHWSLIRVSDGGNLTITGDGTLEAREGDCFAVDLYDTTSKCTIENGTFIGNIHAVYVYNGNLTVNGGTFSVKQKYSTEYPDEYVLNCYDDSYKNRTASITVSGGTFLGFNPQNCRAEGVDTNFCAEGYVGVIEKTEDENTYYTVKPLSEVAVAKTADGKMHTTLAEAVDVAPTGSTITMLADTNICESEVTVPVDKSLTLDLNGKEIETDNAPSFTVEGQIIIQDSAGTGKIFSEKPYATDNSTGIVCVDGENAKLTLQSGTIDAASNFTDWTNNGQFGVVLRDGGDFTMTGGKIEAGWYAVSGNGKNDTQNSEINITGGELVSRGDYAIYLPQSGTTTISGGTIYGAAGGINIKRGTLIIEDGALITSLGTGSTGSWGDGTGGDDCAALNVSAEYGDCTVSITGGALAAQEKALIVEGESDNSKMITITGGYFTSDPSEYCPEGLAGLPGQYVVDGNTYQYMVGKKLENVTVATGETEAKKATGVTMDTVDVEKISKTKADGLTPEANDTASNLPEADKANITKYNEEITKITGASAAAAGANITTVIAPRLEIEITGYDKGTTEKSLTLKIEAVYDIKATTATGDTDMVEYDADASDASKVNTVTIEKNAGTLDTTGQEVVISIPLPDGFVTTNTKTIYVQHKGYEYKADVTETGADASKTYTATFTNPHGFSTFGLSTEPKAVATVNGTNYTNFQQAVNAAGTSTIEVKADGQTATDVTHSLTLKNGTNGPITVTINGKTIMIPAGGTETFTYTAPTPPRPTEEKHSITISTDGKGQVTGPASAAEDDKVTLTVKPGADKELYDLKVTGEDGKAIAVTKVNDTTYTFTMPDGKVTVAATFGCDGGDNCPSKAFTDLGDKQWYHDSIDYAVENGLLEGTSPTTMEPNATLIRAQLAQILYNIEDKPAVTGEMIFEDVPASEWFYGPVLWANQNEIINGTSATTFEPLEAITRQDLALMLYRYAGEPKVTGDLDGFTDADQVGDWAEEAMAWAVAEGIVQGDTPTTLNPTGTATRAEAAAMLQRFLENAA